MAGYSGREGRPGDLKEPIFSGLNNLVAYSLLNLGFAEYFGFTPPEVERLLQDVGLTSCLPLIERWYLNT